MDRGNVIGSRPDGLTTPVSTSAIASPPDWPGNHASTIALTRCRSGRATGFPVSRTTIVLGFAAATASISASCPYGRDKSGASKPSDSWRVAKTIATADGVAHTGGDV